MTGYEQLLTLADQDPRILGVILSGSRGRGTAVSASDWDCYAIVADGSADDLQTAFDDIGDGSLDLTVLAITEFERYARPGTVEDWEAYAFVHALVVLDRLGGGIAELAARKETLDDEVAEARARGALDPTSTRRFAAPNAVETGSGPRPSSMHPNRLVRRWRRYSHSTIASARTTAISRGNLNGTRCRRKGWTARGSRSSERFQRVTSTHPPLCLRSWSSERVHMASATCSMLGRRARSGSLLIVPDEARR